MIYSIARHLFGYRRLILTYLLVFISISIFGQNRLDKANKSAFKVLLISDLNDSYGTIGYSAEVKDVVSRIQEIKPDLILCAGDMVAGQKASLSLEHLRQMWQSFNQTVLNSIQDLHIPFGFTMGNHDASPNYLLDRQASSEFWLNQKDHLNLSYVDTLHYPFYFSFIQNHVFFISWDASSSQITDELKIWMKKQLSSKAAKRSKGRIVLGHLPLYAIVDAKNKAGEVVDNADEMLQMFQKFNVDMYISGHQHAYFPAYKEKVLLLNSGCLGGGPRKLIGDSQEPKKAYSLITIPRGGKVKDADIQGFQPIIHQPIQISQMPDSIIGFNGVIRRIDDSRIMR